MIKLRFTVPVPSGSKNSRQLFVTKSGRPGSQPSTRAKRSRAVIRGAAIQALNEIGLRSTARAEDGSLFGPDDDIGMNINHNVKEGTVTVEVWASGPKPPSPTGRGRDVDNFASTIMDALQGIGYVDDKQVASLEVKRV